MRRPFSDVHILVFIVHNVFIQSTSYSYDIRNHPCCMPPEENVTLAMIIDAFEIYGHDPTDKLDNLWLYSNEMMRVKTAEDQFQINELIHIATDHLGRFIKMHVQELKVLLIALDDVIDNMLTMYENHNAIAAERKATYNGGPVPMEFYMSQEFYCGKNVYIFVSEIYSDIYNIGKGPMPYCKDRMFVFLGFIHFQDDRKYYLIEDASVSFPTDNYIHGLECHVGICIFRFPFKKIAQKERDVSAMPKAIVKCGVVVYKLPPLSAVSCIIASGSFIFDFNIQGIRYRHYDFMLTIPNGAVYYTKEKDSPLICHHHVCEWNNTNPYGGPFIVPGDPKHDDNVVPPFTEPTTKAPPDDDDYIPYDNEETCFYFYPPTYGSIAGKSYLEAIEIHYDRFACNTGAKGLYWYPQWMGALPNHPFEEPDSPPQYQPPPGEVYPHSFDEMDDFDVEP